MEKSNIPTNLYAEMTPNPNAMKFVANRLIMQGDDGVEFKSGQEAKGHSGLAENLFNFPFVKSVYIIGNFVSITKNDSINWDFVTMELREFITDYLTNNEWAIQKMPEAKSEKTASENTIQFEQKIETDIDRKIVDLLNEHVKPAVENDGGAIDFKSFDDGVVTVILRGACSGCPSSMMTLKGGIEQMLTQMVPEVKSVVAEEM